MASTPLRERKRRDEMHAGGRRRGKTECESRAEVGWIKEIRGGEAANREVS